MKKFAERLKSEQGFSLMELIAAITLASMILGLISIVTIFGFRTYHKITIENSLRDEADLIMSSIITELYTYGPELVGNSADGIKLVKGIDDKEIKLLPEENGESGTPKTQLVITEKDNENNVVDRATAIKSDLRGSTITSRLADGRECSSEAPSCQSGLIDITLVLTQYYDGKRYDLTLESKFGF